MYAQDSKGRWRDMSDETSASSFILALLHAEQARAEAQKQEEQALLYAIKEEQ